VGVEEEVNLKPAVACCRGLIDPSINHHLLVDVFARSTDKNGEQCFGGVDICSSFSHLPFIIYNLPAAPSKVT
jgi:hypothetical protein